MELLLLIFFPIPEQLSAIPQFNSLGPLFKSSDMPTELTESETEYVVRCVKHTYKNHLVFQVRFAGLTSYMYMYVLHMCK